MIITPLLRGGWSDNVKVKMIIEDRKKEFGVLIKRFREYNLGMGISEFCRLMSLPRTKLYKLESGEAPFIGVNTICCLLDLGFPIHTLKNKGIEQKVNDYLRLEKFKKKLHYSKELRFHFEMFCELDKEYIEKNYVKGILEQFKTGKENKQCMDKN